MASSTMESATTDWVPGSGVALAGMKVRLVKVMFTDTPPCDPEKASSRPPLLL